MKDFRLWVIMILALAVRTAPLFSVFASAHPSQTADSYQCDDLIEVLFWRGNFGQARQPGAGATPEIDCAPGYPALVAGGAWIAT